MDQEAVPLGLGRQTNALVAGLKRYGLGID